MWEKRAWAYAEITQFFGVPPIISGMGKATNFRILYAHSLKSDLSLHNLTFEDAIELAMDKPLWRLLVASGATH